MREGYRRSWQSYNTDKCGKCLGKSRAGPSKISPSHISREVEVNWNNLSVAVNMPSEIQKLLNLWERWNLSKHKHGRTLWTWLWNLPLENTLGEVQDVTLCDFLCKWGLSEKKLADVIESCQASPHPNLIKSQMDIIRTGFLYQFSTTGPFSCLLVCMWLGSGR